MMTPFSCKPKGFIGVGLPRDIPLKQPQIPYSVVTVRQTRGQPYRTPIKVIGVVNFNKTRIIDENKI